MAHGPVYRLANNRRDSDHDGVNAGSPHAYIVYGVANSGRDSDHDGVNAGSPHAYIVYIWPMVLYIDWLITGVIVIMMVLMQDHHMHISYMVWLIAGGIVIMMVLMQDHHMHISYIYGPWSCI